MAAEYICLAGGAAVTGVFSYLWKRKAKILSDVKDAPLLEINNDLKVIIDEAPSKSIPYAIVEGKVYADGPAIRSDYVLGAVGVIQSLVCREHKTEWSKATRLWHDTTRSIRDTVKTVPFFLSPFTNVSSPCVKVEDPLEAAHLTLETIYDKFHQTNASWGENLLNWATGEKTKGFQEIEKMLPEGRTVLGIGELSLANESVVLGPPSNGREYILTTSNMAGLLKDLQSSVKTWKVLSIIFGSVTIVIFLYWLRKRYQKYTEQRDYEDYLQRVREGRGIQGSTGSPSEDVDVCAVCLTNRRDCVLLNCGHVCVCSRCVKDLQPPQCPICRQRIARTVPLYHA
ncbi:mitochondrial ubiquitin ligase activator of NFKB 1-like [Amphiura filiformis]|uniref:mitochondrial ubiquitin ligase activator of NFKB 1-like n=1 Tax=Amphiura filiformis TaxID=82378 RepID=UPI003B22437E